MSKFITTVIVSIMLSLTVCARAAFDWFHPAAFVIVGGQDPFGKAVATPDMLRANVFETALEHKKSFPGTQIVIGLWWWPSNDPGMVDINTSKPHLAALKRGLREAVQILGGTDKVVFIPFIGMKDECILKIREEIGINVGKADYDMWRYSATRSRKHAAAIPGINLDHTKKDIPYDFVDKMYADYEKKNMVVYVLIHPDGQGLVGSSRLLNPDGTPAPAEDLVAEDTRRAWEKHSYEYARLFGKYKSFVSIILDEPSHYLWTGKDYLKSKALAAEYKTRFGTEMPPIPVKPSDRKGKEYLQIVSLLQGSINDYVERCQKAMHRGFDGTWYTTALVSVEFPVNGYDHLRPSMDVPQWDPYAYWDSQVYLMSQEAELYDDAYKVVQKDARVYIVYPRRAYWKYWEIRYPAAAELATALMAYHQFTPLVDTVTDDLFWQKLGELKGVVVMPLVRVTDETEDQKLIDWVARGNVLVLSTAVAMDRLLQPKPITEDRLLRNILKQMAARSFADSRMDARTYTHPDAKINDCTDPKTSIRWNNTELFPNRTAGPLMTLALKPESHVRILSTVDNKPLGIMASVGKGKLIIAFGQSDLSTYPYNVDYDPYLRKIGEMALTEAKVPAARPGKTDPSVVFLNSAGNILAVYNNGPRSLALSARAEAYGLTGVKQIRFREMEAGKEYKPGNDGNIVVLPFGPDERLKILRLEENR